MGALGSPSDDSWAAAAVAAAEAAAASPGPTPGAPRLDPAADPLIATGLGAGNKAGGGGAAGVSARMRSATTVALEKSLEKGSVPARVMDQWLQEWIHRRAVAPGPGGVLHPQAGPEQAEQRSPGNGHSTPAGSVLRKSPRLRRDRTGETQGGLRPNGGALMTPPGEDGGGENGGGNGAGPSSLDQLLNMGIESRGHRGAGGGGSSMNRGLSPSKDSQANDLDPPSWQCGGTDGGLSACGVAGSR